jgi:hypothetical protein
VKIGIVGGDGKRTPPLIEYISEQLGALSTWHVTAGSNTKAIRGPADVILVLVDYCGHPLYMAAKAHAERVGAIFLTASIQRSKTQEVLEVLKTNTNKVRQLLENKYGCEFLTQKQILQEYLIGVSTLLNYCDSKLLEPSAEGVTLGAPAKLFARPEVDKLLRAKGHSTRLPSAPMGGLRTPPLPQEKLDELTRYLFVEPGSAQMVPAEEVVPPAPPAPEAPPAPVVPPTPPHAPQSYLLLRKQSSGESFTTVTTLDTLEGVSALVEADMEKNSTASESEYTVVEVRKVFKARRAITITEG